MSDDQWYGLFGLAIVCTMISWQGYCYARLGRDE